MNLNNFNTSTEEFDLSLSLFRDETTAQCEFQESFQVIEYATHFSGSFLYYGSPEHPEAPRLDECWDFSKAKISQLQEAILDVSSYSAEELAEEELFSHADFVDFLQCELQSNYSLKEFMRDGFPEWAGIPCLVSVSSASGFSQGDYSTILYFPGDFGEGFEKEAYKMFSNLIFDRPVFCRLEVNNEEIYLSEGLADPYEYEIGELITYAKKCLQPPFWEEGCAEFVAEWLERSLPEYA